jgi:prepilin-type N-terminal cleavage/methylation domain-containing protein
MRPTRDRSEDRQSRRGFTLIEVMVAVAIIGILAAIAIPIFRGYVLESKITEVTTNLQGILEAQEAYFVRFRQYTADLPLCPPGATPGANQNWPQDMATTCAQGWEMLGWRPDAPVYFQYQTFSLYDNAGQRVQLPSALPAGGWGVDWTTEFSNDLNDIQPWCAVQAIGDTDGDGANVTFRSNSYNHAIFRDNRDEF